MIRAILHKIGVSGLLIMIFWTSHITAQTHAINEVNTLSFSASFAYAFPVGRLSDRFGSGYQVAGLVEWMTWPGNWVVGLEGRYGYGADVRENVLGFLQDRDGEIVGRDLSLSNVFLSARLMTIGLYGGKLHSLNKENARSGIRWTIGLAHLRHWIKVNDEMRSLPQIEGEYAKGYDRLTAGYALTQFIGFQHVSLDRRLNIIVGFDLMEGLTRSQRDYDYQLQMGDKSTRIDMTIGFRAGIAVGLYSGYQAGDIYY